MKIDRWLVALLFISITTAKDGESGRRFNAGVWKFVRRSYRTKTPIS
jgi:hypothetical protein